MDEDVAKKLRSKMKQIKFDEVNNMWTFLNNGKAEYELSANEKKLVTYTNKIEL
jgi:hypothetical protein